jgi:hypothetical protein
MTTGLPWKTRAFVVALLLSACAATAPAPVPARRSASPSAVRGSKNEPPEPFSDCWISWPTARFQSLPAVPDVVVDELVRFAGSDRPASERFAAATGVFLADYEANESRPRCDRLAGVSKVLSAFPRDFLMYDPERCLPDDVMAAPVEGSAPTVDGMVAVVRNPSLPWARRSEAMRDLGAQAQPVASYRHELLDVVARAIRHRDDEVREAALRLLERLCFDGESEGCRGFEHRLARLLQDRKVCADVAELLAGWSHLEDSTSRAMKDLFKTGSFATKIHVAHRELRLGQLSYEGRQVLREALLGIPDWIVAWAGEAEAWDLVEAAAFHPAWLSRRRSVSEIRHLKDSGWTDREPWRPFLFSPAVAGEIVLLLPNDWDRRATPARLWADFTTAYYYCNRAAQQQHSPWCSLRFSWRGADAPELAGDRDQGTWYALSSAPMATRAQTARCGDRLAQSAADRGVEATAYLLYEATHSLAWPEGSADEWLGNLADAEYRLQASFSKRPMHLLYAALASDAANREARRKWLPAAIRRELAGAVDTPYWTLLAAALGRHRDDIPLMLEWLGSDDSLQRRMAIDALIVH